MTIGSIASRVNFLCNGVSTVFPVPIQAYLATDFEVILTAPLTSGGAETELTLNSDYSLATSGTDSPPQWRLTTLGATPYAAGYTLTVFLDPVQNQETQYVQGQAFPSLAVQTNFDRLTQMVQRCQDQLNRTVLAPDGDISPVTILPPAAERALTTLGFDLNGNTTLTAQLATALTQAMFNGFYSSAPQSTFNSFYQAVPQSYFNTALAAAYPSLAPFAQTPAESTAGVTILNPEYAPGKPERYGNFSYATDTSGTTGSSANSAIQAALSCGGQPCILGAHNYLFSNIVIPAAQGLIGMGQRLTNLIAAAGSSGIAITDAGSAAGVVVSGIAAYCNGPSTNNNTSYTGGLKLGFNATQFGTNGNLYDIWIRDLPAGFPGIDINGNIWRGDYLCAQSTGGARFIGSGAAVGNLSVPFSLGFTSSRTSTTVASQFTSDGWIGYIEHEAWANAMPCMQIDNLLNIGKADIAFNNSVQWVGDHVVEITGNATSGQIGSISAFANGPAPSITGGWVKYLGSGTYAGGTGTHGGEGMWVVGPFNGAAAITGWGTPTGATTVANFPGASATLVQCSEVIAQLITQLKALGFLAT